MLLFFTYCEESNTWLSSGLTPGSWLRDNSWWFSRNHMQYWGFWKGLAHARKAPYLEKNFKGAYLGIIKIPALYSRVTPGNVQEMICAENLIKCQEIICSRSLNEQYDSSMCLISCATAPANVLLFLEDIEIFWEPKSYLKSFIGQSISLFSF